MRKLQYCLAAAALFTYGAAAACTNFIVTKGASTDGSAMVSYAADSHALYGALYHTPGGKFRAGAMLPVYEWDTGRYLTDIPQAGETYSTVGNMNEHSLIIGETTYGGRPELEDSTGLIDYGSLIYITLQRAKTAREAILTIAELANTYGYASSGESFSIVDPEEAWIMELIGKGYKDDGKGGNARKGIVWVARRIPDGYVSAPTRHVSRPSRRTTPRTASIRPTWWRSPARWVTTTARTRISVSAKPMPRPISARCEAARPACGHSSARWPTEWTNTWTMRWGTMPKTACPCG